MSAPAPTPPPAAPPKRRPRLLLRSFATLIAGVLLVGGAIAAAVAWLLGTTSGMHTLIALADRFTPVAIETRGGFGALSREFGFAELRVVAGTTTVEATEVRAQIRQARWQPLQLGFSHLLAKALRVRVADDGKEDSGPPQDIGVPLRLSATRLEIGELAIDAGAPFSLQSVAGRVSAGPDGYRVDDGKLAIGAHTASLAAELGGRRPFPLSLQADVTAVLQERSVNAALTARGSLVEMTVDGRLDGAARGRLAAVIRSFDAPAVQSLNLDLVGIDPRFWHPQAPIADLAVKAQLVPDEGMQRIGGTVSIVNRAPGLLDAERIPVRSATARIEADAQGLRVDRIAARLTQGSASGEFSLVFAEGRWHTRAQLADVDPAQIHGALQPLRVDGSVQAQHAGDATTVVADLEHRGDPAASLALAAQVTPARATIERARLALGDGFATASGTIELAGAFRAELHGELQRFEPGRLVKGVDAQLNGSLLVDGVLQPQPAGRVRFELADSRAWGRPLSGRGQVDLDAARQLDVDLDLAVRSARLSAKGGLGAGDRSLQFALDVPALAEVLPELTAPPAGRLLLTGTATGEWTAPAVKADLTARELRFGEHALASLQVDAAYGGGADGTVRVEATAAGYELASQPAAALRSLNVAVDGRLTEHGIRVQGIGDKAGRALLLAEGGWRDAGWRGRLREATIGPPLDLRLLEPAALALTARGFDFGPARFDLQHVRFDGVRFAADAAGMATQGRLGGLQPMLLVPPIEGAMAPVLAPTGERPPLVLRGDWDLRLAEGRADGRLLVERAGGDLYAGRGADSALRLVDARLVATLQANALSAIARIESERSGGIGAHLDAWVEQSAEAGWRLAQSRPWLINGAFDLPTMDWINALLSDHVRANVRLGGQLAGTVRIEGTPASPTAAGRLSGEALRVAWVEQGVRLENGSLRAHLQDDVIVLDELRFVGPPRVRPDDRRALASLKGEREGSVSANGRLRLRDFTGVIQVAASDLPLLQRPDRWVIASGGGNIEMTARHVQMNGAAAAQAGFVDFSRSELPSLSSDVFVVRAEQPAPSRQRRVTVGFDLGIDLGSGFYLRGSGLDTRVEGALRLRSAGLGAVTAVGTIEAVDGVYEGFGQKLRIARGRLNFQGAPENPGLDILALRTGLPVEVGVTITRTAVDPLVRLHSDPPMADVEALSWLVLGRAADQSRGDNIALVQAAASLLGGGGEGYPTRVVRALGFDELTIRSGQLGAASLLPSRSVAGALRSDEASSATVAGEIVTIGKRFSDALSVSYEQAISGTSRIVQMNYQLTRRLSLVARAGTDNALDLVYSIAFD